MAGRKVVDVRVVATVDVSWHSNVSDYWWNMMCARRLRLKDRRMS